MVDLLCSLVGEDDIPVVGHAHHRPPQSGGGVGDALVGGPPLGGIGALLALPVAASLTALVQTYGDHHEVIQSESFQSPEEYEAQMRAKTEEKARQKEEKKGRLRRRLPSKAEEQES
jgi:2-polyprenyl-6-methoxyphenol hydroxylase-like FAD-dependent oxidoreductase